MLAKAIQQRNPSQNRADVGAARSVPVPNNAGENVIITFLGTNPTVEPKTKDDPVTRCA